MNRLSNAASASIDDAKTRDYLLNPGNTKNCGKAALFGTFGFTRDGWQALADALRRHPVENHG